MSGKGIAVLLVILAVSQNACTSRPPFDAGRAFADLEKQCRMGPRNPGSPGHQQCLEFLVSELEALTDHVRQQKFRYVDRHDSTAVFEGTNVIASINLEPKKKKRVMIGAHWDTRPWADRDPDSSKHQTPIIGANDGASGVAILLEVARAIRQQPLDIGVDIFLFDMEDYGEHGYELKPDSLNPYCIGSDYFAKNNKNYFPAYGIIIDMVGDKDLDLPIENYSYVNAKDVVNKVWGAAKKLEKPAFRHSIEDAIFDDHIAFQKIGIPCIDIIDFNYPDETNRYWHTMQDTPDKCSPESLKQVGEVLLEVLYSE